MTRETRMALNAFAKAVRLVDNILDKPEPAPDARYLATEYASDMEDLLLRQLATSTDNQNEMDRVLIDAGLEHLMEPLHDLVAQWSRE